MSAITYRDSFGDEITEFEPFQIHDSRVTVALNQTGWRLLPPGCWCGNPARFHVVRRYQSGEAQTFCCSNCLPPEITGQLPESVQ